MTKLVACKACEKEIAKGVKKCPNCGKDQRNWFMKHKILTTMGIILIFIIVGSLGDGDDNQNQLASNDATAAEDGNVVEEKEASYKVGEVFTEDQLELTVTVVEEMETIGDPSFLGKKAAEGGILIGIQYKMKNVSEEPVGMFSYPTVSLVDENGTEYSSDIDASSSYAVETEIDDSKIFSDLNPGISVTSTAVYEVSKEKFAQGKWYVQIGNSKVQLK